MKSLHPVHHCRFNHKYQTNDVCISKRVVQSANLFEDHTLLMGDFSQGGTHLKMGYRYVQPLSHKSFFSSISPPFEAVLVPQDPHFTNFYKFLVLKPKILSYFFIPKASKQTKNKFSKTPNLVAVVLYNLLCLALLAAHSYQNTSWVPPGTFPKSFMRVYAFQME